MKVLTFLGAGLLAATSFATIPTAEAQRHGYHHRGPDRHYGGRQGWRGDRWHRGGPRWRGDRGWRGDRWDRGRRWRGDRGYGRVVCRAGYHGRECFRTYR